MEADGNAEALRPRWCSAALVLRGALVAAAALVGLCGQWADPLLALARPGDPGAANREPAAPLRLLGHDGQGGEEDHFLTPDEREEVMHARRQDAEELRRSAARESLAAAWRSSPSQYVVRQSRGRTEWVVVFASGPVRVRSAMLLSAKKLGERFQGDVLFGRVDGEWLALAHEPGYVKRYLEDPPTALLEQRTATYTQLAEGACSDHDYHVIVDTQACEAAAAALGYVGGPPRVNAGDGAEPEGCYVADGKVWMSDGMANMGNGVVGGKQPLCSSEVYPAVVKTSSS